MFTNYLYSIFAPWEASLSCSLLLSNPITLSDLKKRLKESDLWKDFSLIWRNFERRKTRWLWNWILGLDHRFARSLVIWPDPQPTSTTSWGSPSKYLGLTHRQSIYMYLKSSSVLLYWLQEGVYLTVNYLLHICKQSTSKGINKVWRHTLQ